MIDIKSAYILFDVKCHLSKWYPTGIFQQVKKKRKIESIKKPKMAKLKLY
jgi:hypothetical protein